MKAVPASPRERELVLVGGGHAHVQVLARINMRPIPGVGVTLVVDRPLAVYSGMLPGFVAGEYRAQDLEIDVVLLARKAGARVVLARAVGVDPGAKRLFLEGERAPMRYDALSFDIGSTVRERELVQDFGFVLATRPIGTFLERFAAHLERLRELDRPARVLVAGGGAAGVELAACLKARLDRELGRPAAVRLVYSGERLVPDLPETFAERVGGELVRRGIALAPRDRIVSVSDPSIRLESGIEEQVDLLVWATGPAAHPLGGESGLAVDAEGFLLATSTLQLAGHPELFGAGDCITLSEHPGLAKSGVYAVREGPVLDRNLRAFLRGAPLERYRPQRDFLALLNLGDGTALGTKRGFVFGGRWVMRLKDRIDRRFMARFQLQPDLAAAAAGRHDMACGGCAAKLEQPSLERVLAQLAPAPKAPGISLGLEARDDVAVVEVQGGSQWVGTVDFFRDFLDDPWLLGRVAAANALSDLQAKGFDRGWALALVVIPLETGPELAEEMLFQVLAGARKTFEASGTALVGGHTARGAELAVGFSVQAVVAGDARIVPRRAPELAAGDDLWLTRPLGTGVLLRAAGLGGLRGPHFQQLERVLCEGNQRALPLLRWARAATDVTGFGLAGHLSSLLEQSNWAAELSLAALPLLPGSARLLASGIQSTFHRFREELVELHPSVRNDPRVQLLFDPQTAGPLLLVVPREARAEIEALLAKLELGEARRIGSILPRESGAPPIRVVL